MYIEDNSNYDYCARKEFKDTLSFGWLEQGHPITQAPKGTSPELRQQVIDLLTKIPVTQKCRGMHFGFEDVSTSNGSKIFTHNGIRYHAPAVVHEYVEKLDYFPPENVVAALLEHFQQSEGSGSPSSGLQRLRKLTKED